MLGGYMGKFLRVDLSSEKVSIESLNFELARKLIGGIGYAVKILNNEVNREIGPFDPKNRLIFMTGPMTGAFWGGTKWSVCSRSPLTCLWGESNASGAWGQELKHAGFDGLVVQGKAQKPVYLWIHEGKCEIKRADHLWGMDTLETCSAIKSEAGEPKARVAAIGPAGEHLVLFASIITDDVRAAGRTGMGAVMGSKNLKAVAVRGTAEILIVDKRRVKELWKELLKYTKPSPNAWAKGPSRIKGLTENGTGGALINLSESGILPTKNWTKGTFGGAIKITGATITKNILTKRGTCPMCTVACHRYIEIKTGPFAPVVGKGPEYETLASLGSLCMNEDLASIAKANELCDRLGIDTISAGSVIAFAMECYEKGIITKKDTGGIDLTWGNSESIVKMVELIGKRKGFGGLLGEGVKRAAMKIGKGTEHFAIHVKGLEIGMHEPRRLWAQGLAYATNNRGGCHTEGSPLYLEYGYTQPDFNVGKSPDFVVEGKANAAKFYQDFCTTITALGFCRFPIAGVVPFTLIAEAFSAVTGWKVDHWELLKCGERIWNLKRVFNIRMGASREDDKLPERFLKEPLPEGPAAGKVVPLEPMLNEYYNLRGWDAEGRPTKEKLKELNLE